MAVIVKALVFVAFVYVISALPLEQESQTADLFSVDDVPQQEGTGAESLNREKRNFGIGKLKGNLLNLKQQSGNSIAQK